jgi:predicted enzyme related to lactoylglutathione lyase
MDKPTIGYVNVFVTDFERAVRFYRDQIGLEVNSEDADFGYASFATRGASFAIAAVSPDSDQADLAGRHTGIGWIVDSVDEAYKVLSERGVSFSSPPTKQPWGGYMAMMEDPDGNVFYLDQPREH